MLSFPSLDDRSGFDFLDSEKLPLLEVELEVKFKSFCLDLEEPLPFLDLELSDLFSDLLPEALEVFVQETSALHSHCPVMGINSLSELLEVREHSGLVMVNQVILDPLCEVIKYLSEEASGMLLGPTECVWLAA